MPLFRFHRGGLHESLQTTIIVKNFNDVVKAIVLSFDQEMLLNQNWGAKFEIKPYPEEGNNFDARIGWYTYMVLANIYEEDEMHPVGFLSEPLE
jgi:hypothetical protein